MSLLGGFVSVQKQYPCSVPIAVLFSLLLLPSVSVMPAFPQGNSARIAVDTLKEMGPMEIDRFALGQGGLSDSPIWEDRIPEIRSLRPRLIRLFIQEYFDLY